MLAVNLGLRACFRSVECVRLSFILCLILEDTFPTSKLMGV